ncbi:hypothetical protein [Spirosoma pollinicola]|uniref:DUF3592 domain-containing protein n=1 Tax=Spirosoma pollinicola TaxID=2057025 RepID=A0A2K8YZC4_9BACT|nr:hypothetical protein [Spirosoma pollinicola]AUD02965.1 hypothetical protein CWM47_14655 [Spirosoma pollinicola]
MVQRLLTAASRLYSFLFSLVVAVILGGLTWISWEFYQEGQLQDEFEQHGHLVALSVDEANQKQRSWRDIMSHSTYLTVTYKGKTYQSRFVMDSAYVGGGDKVNLLYHPGYDAFRQPGHEVRFDQSKRKSRLIEWTSIRDLTNQHRLLLFCLLLSIASFFCITGLIVTIIPVPFLSAIARFLFVASLAIAAIFLTYDGWAYVQYYQHIKAHGIVLPVHVLDTRKRVVGHHSSKGPDWYRYEATIAQQQRERVIPISEADYDALKPGDTLITLFDESVDDLMSTDYGPDYSLVLLPAFFWLLTFLFIRPFFDRGSTKAVS